jgi:hypothetical protein
MNWKRTTATVIGGVLMALGVLWFLQGSGLINVNPIMCFTDCDPLAEQSVDWSVQGIASFVVGAAICLLAIFKKKNQQ